jgi:hypothetical protein
VLSPTARVARSLRLCSAGLLVLLVVLVCLHAFESYTTWRPPLQADEAGHALPAARMALDLRRGAFGAFFADTQREMTWPFVHPWLLAVSFLAFGISTEVARGASLVFLGAAIVLAFLLARKLAALSEPGTGAEPPAPSLADALWLGTPTALLMVCTPDFWVHSSTVMIEPLGMLLTLGCLLAYAAASTRPSPLRHAAAGMLAALTFLTKYNYGLPLVAALLLSRAAAREPSRRGRGTAFLLAGFAPPVILWLAYPFPDKLQALYSFSVNRDEGLSGLADLLFYPQKIAETVSWPLTIWLLAAAVLSLRRVRDGRTSAATLFALVGLAMITAHPNKQLRYVFTILPVLYVLGELELRRVARRFLPLGAQWLLWPVLLVLLGVALDPHPVLRAERQSALALRGAAEIMDFVVARVRPEGRTLVLGSGGLLPHLLLQWELVTRYGARDPVVDLLPFPGEVGWDPRYRQGYPAEMTPEYDRVLGAALRDGGYDRVVTLDIAEDSAFNPEWLRRWDAWSRNYVVAMERQSLYAAVADQRFPASGVLVRVYALSP